MGTEAIWIPLVMSAVATGASVYNSNQTAKRQDKQLASQLRSQADKQRQADARTAQLIQQQAASTDADERAGSLAKFTEQIQAHKAQAQRPLQSVGAVSDAYKQAGSDAALGMGQYAGNIASLLSSIDAPTQQRQNDALLAGRYQTDIGQLRRFSDGDDFLHQMRLRGIQRNPWIDAGASALGGAANAYGSGQSATVGENAYLGWLANDPRFAGPY